MNLRDVSARVVRHPHRLFVAVLLAGFLLRIFLLTTSTHLLDDDQAAIYLMARHVSHGELVAMYWGQNYGGTLLQLIAGLVFFLIGPSWAALAIVEVVFWAVAAVFLWLLVRIISGNRIAIIAVCIFWFPGITLARLTTLDPGFYGPSVALALAAFFIVFSAKKKMGTLRWAVFGLVCGLALWTAPTALVAALVALAFALIWRSSFARRAIFTRAPLFVAAALAGSAPFWIYNVRHDWGGLTLFSGQTANGGLAGSFGKAIELVTAVIPGSISFDVGDQMRSWWWSNWPSANSAPVLQPTSYSLAQQLIVIVPLVIALVYTCFMLIRARNLRGGVFMIAGAATFVVVASASYGAGIDNFRYAAFLLPWGAFILASLVSKWRWSGIAASILSIGVTVGFSVASYDYAGRDGNPGYGPGISAVVNYLESQGDGHVFGDYWLSYRITAASDEKITVAPLQPVAFRRYQRYEDEAVAARPTVVVLYPHNQNEKTLRAMKDVQWKKRVIGGYVILTANHPVNLLTEPLGFF
jgi:hypothetical protein